MLVAVPVFVAVALAGSAAFYSGTATGISTATNTAFPTVPVGDGPMALDFTPDSKTVYVVNSFSDNVTPITVATDTPGPAIPIGSQAVPGTGDLQLGGRRDNKRLRFHLRRPDH